MRKITGNHKGFCSRSIATGLVLLLVVAGWPATAASNSELDWPRVQNIKPGTPIMVVLHKDRGPRGDRKVRGRFQSATDDSLTLKMEYGPTRTLPRSAVRKVLVPKSKRDWSRVQAVAPGTPAAVFLYKDQAPSWELRRIKGRFHSTTDDSLTLTLKDGQRRTFQKSAVRKVLVHRPIGKRYQGWIAAAVGVISWVSLMSWIGDPTRQAVAIFAGVLIGAPTSIGFLTAKMGVIYNVPPQHRTQPPADQPSGAEGKVPGKQKNRQ